MELNTTNIWKPEEEPLDTDEDRNTLEYQGVISPEERLDVSSRSFWFDAKGAGYPNWYSIDKTEWHWHLSHVKKLLLNRSQYKLQIDFL